MGSRVHQTVVHGDIIHHGDLVRGVKVSGLTGDLIVQGEGVDPGSITTSRKRSAHPTPITRPSKRRTASEAGNESRDGNVGTDGDDDDGDDDDDDDDQVSFMVSCIPSHPPISIHLIYYENIISHFTVLDAFLFAFFCLLSTYVVSTRPI